jgi:hypothetical protein
LSYLLGWQTRGRDAAFGAAFAALVSPHAAIALMLGAAGLLGNGIFTGLFLSGSTVLVWFLTFRNDFTVSALDYMFAGFVAVVICSVLSNGMTAEPKEYALLILTLSAYPACRFISAGDLTRGRDAFIGFLGIVVLAGTLVTLVALTEEWGGFRSKPLIFGFGALPIFGLQSLSYLIFAVLMMRQLTTRSTLVFSLLLLIPLATFASALVRFTFVALVAALVVGACASSAWRRKNVLIVIAAIALSVAAGFGSRPQHIARYVSYAIGGGQTDPDAPPPKVNEAPAASKTDQAPAASPADSASVPAHKPEPAVKLQNRAPSCTTETNVNLQNSIAIRKVLLLDAAFMLPGAGLLGYGLDAFMKVTCMTGHEMHNSVLQAFVEFGWLGGILFGALVVTSLWSILRAAKADAASRFVLCGLTFVALLCLVHGRLSREAALFAWIGAVAGITQSARTRAPVTQPAKPLVLS